MNLYDLIIIGAGPAGMTAAIYAKRADLNVLMLEKLAPGGQIINTNEIQNYTGTGTINGADLAYRMYEHTQELEIEFDYATVVQIIDEGKRKRIICEEDNKEYQALSVIIATGTKPRRLGIEGEDKFAGKNLSWCAVCDGMAYRDKDVVVIGGGNSAVEEAIFLAGITKTLTVVTMFDLTADHAVCSKLIAMDNVTIYPYQEILKFAGDKKIDSVYFKSTKTGEVRVLPCDGVFEYIGLEPVTGAFKDMGILDSNGYIKTNAKMHTEVEGIYAAGDCIIKDLRQVITACADGAVAAIEASHYIQMKE